MASDISVIAEIGVNHDGSLSKAIDLLHASQESGATLAKIQIFDPKTLVHDSAGLAPYQESQKLESQRQADMLSKLTLSVDELMTLDETSKEIGLPLFATPFDLGSLEFIIKTLGHERIKIGSGDLTYLHLIFEAAKSGKDLLISTGMSNLSSVSRAVDVAVAGRLVFEGRLPTNFVPTRENLRTNISDYCSLGWLTILHCTSSYPAPVEDLNIAAIKPLSTMGTNLGYSDHSKGPLGAILALALGARIFEKHITLSALDSGPDHEASLEPHGFAEYVRTLEGSAAALGNGIKDLQPSELPNVQVVRRSMFAARAIERGSTIVPEDIATLRPASGRGAEDYFEILGNLARRNYAQGDPIE